MLVGLETVSDAQHAVPIYRAAASLALWQGDHADAGRAAGPRLGPRRGTGRLEPHREDGGDRGRGRLDGRGRRRRRAATSRPWRRSAAARGTVVRRRDRRSSDPASGRRSARAARRTRGSPSRRPTGIGSRAATTRRPGTVSPTPGTTLANPYEVAKARWRQAEAILGTRRGPGGAAAGPGRRSRRRPGSPSACPPGPSCARSASSPAGR